MFLLLLRLLFLLCCSSSFTGAVWLFCRYYIVSLDDVIKCPRIRNYEHAQYLWMIFDMHCIYLRLNEINLAHLQQHTDRWTRWDLLSLPARQAIKLSDKCAYYSKIKDTNSIKYVNSSFDSRKYMLWRDDSHVYHFEQNIYLVAFYFICWLRFRWIMNMSTHSADYPDAIFAVSTNFVAYQILEFTLNTWFL